MHVYVDRKLVYAALGDSQAFSVSFRLVIFAAKNV